MIAAIDIGTSFSRISVLETDGSVHPVEIGTGASIYGSKYTLPCGVYADQNGKILVGQAAMHQRKLDRARFSMDFISHLGEITPIALGEKRFSPEQLCLELLKHMNRQLQKQGKAVTGARLTVPVSWDESRRNSLLRAAREAGFAEAETVEAPAAAMCSCKDRKYREGENILVCDFGGGSLKTALLSIREDGLSAVKASGETAQCSGSRMDRLVFQDMISRIPPDMMAELIRNPSEMMRFTVCLEDLAVEARHFLSCGDVFCDYLSAGTDRVLYELTSDHFNEMVAPLVDSGLEQCRNLMDQAEIKTSDLTSVLLVGGVSHVPVIQKKIREMAGGVPVILAEDMDLAAAQGALLLQPEDKKDETIKIQEHAKTTEPETVPEAAKTQEPQKVPEPKKLEQADLQPEQDLIPAAELEEQPGLEDILTKAIPLSVLSGEPEEIQISTEPQIPAEPQLPTEPQLPAEPQLPEEPQLPTEQKVQSSLPQWEELEQHPETWLTGPKQVTHQALPIYELAAEKNFGPGQYVLGSICLAGALVPKDENRGARLLQKAADQDIPEAMPVLAECYAQGTGVTKNLDQAIFWYHRAIDAGVDDCERALGSCYQERASQPEDLQQAVDFYYQAAQKQDSQAMLALARCCEDGIGVERDEIQATAWYQAAADLDDPEAQCHLGLAYAGGFGVEANAVMAESWLRRAADGGCQDAAQKLTDLISWHTMTAAEKELKRSEKLERTVRNEFLSQGIDPMGSCFESARCEQRENFRIPFDEHVILSYDSALIHSGQSGFAITDRGFYAKTRFTEPCFYRWQEFSELDISRQTAGEIRLTDHRLLMDCSGLDESAVLKIVLNLQREYRHLRIQYPQMF